MDKWASNGDKCGQIRRLKFDVGDKPETGRSKKVDEMASKRQLARALRLASDAKPSSSRKRPTPIRELLCLVFYILSCTCWKPPGSMSNSTSPSPSPQGSLVQSLKDWGGKLHHTCIIDINATRTRLTSTRQFLQSYHSGLLDSSTASSTPQSRWRHLLPSLTARRIIR